MVKSVAADFDSYGMAKVGGYDFFFVFALQSNVSLKFGLKLAPSLLGLFHHP